MQANEGAWSWRITTPALLAHAVKERGWRFIPNEVLPPLLANATVGAILYTTYLQTLGYFHEPAGRQTKRIYPPAPVLATAPAGFVAGGVQSIAAAPLDALQVRFNTAEVLEGTYKSSWHYAAKKLREIGARGVFAGFSLSFVKDSVGNALFFATFEAVKSNFYYEFIRRWYGDYKPKMEQLILLRDDKGVPQEKPVIRPHFAMEPAFMLAAGVSASIAQSVIQHPLSAIQQVHYGRLEALDYAAGLEKRPRMMQLYYNAYTETLKQCRKLAIRGGGWRKWLYKDLLWTTIRQTPSTSAGLIIFELVRRRYSADDEWVRIHKDGFDILLN